jgi:hypothetical protein
MQNTEKEILIARVLIVFLASLGLLTNTTLAATTADVAGTGVTFVVPANMKPTALGTSFTDASGESIIVFSAGSSARNLEKDKTYMMLFTDAPEVFKNDRIEGRESLMNPELVR